MSDEIRIIQSIDKSLPKNLILLQVINGSLSPNSTVEDISKEQGLDLKPKEESADVNSPVRSAIEFLQESACLRDVSNNPILGVSASIDL